MMKNFFGLTRRSPVESVLDEYRQIIESAKSFKLRESSDEELAQRIRQIADRFRGESTGYDGREPLTAGVGAVRGGRNLSRVFEAEVFALVREAALRSVGLDAFDVQMFAGLAITRGYVAELPTGEGKTLAGVFAACHRGLSGDGVHLLTFNDYLARRDSQWMGPIYERLGLSVGCIQNGMSVEEKRAAYACDITYSAAKEAGFDFLRDQIAYEPHDLVHRRFNFAIIDEADSILIDESRIPLVLSGAEDRNSRNTGRLPALVAGLEAGRDFETDEERQNVFLTDVGCHRVESILGCGSLYNDNQALLTGVYCALHAHVLLRRDVDYIVRDGQIEIVDEHTGRVVAHRHWPDGLQAAVEAKEGLSRRTDARILGSITLQHFFRFYTGLGGMTATATASQNEFREFYGLKIVAIPPHTPSIRVDYPDIIFRDRLKKHQAIVENIRTINRMGRPILVGTSSIKESEELATDLAAAGVTCRVLNAKNDESEASIVANAGVFGAVTISTNMAGRGVDIRLGGQDEREREKVVVLGGLYVIGTNRHDSSRIDLQLRGRAGRQGDPGTTRFFVSLEDDLFARYGLAKLLGPRLRFGREGEFAPSIEIQDEISYSQRVISEQNLDICRFLYKYSSLVDLQRQIVEEWRRKVLWGSSPDSPNFVDCSDQGGRSLEAQELAEPMNEVAPITEFALREPVLFEKGTKRFGNKKMLELVRRSTLFYIDQIWSDHLAWIQDTRDSIHLVSLGGKEPLDEFRVWATAEFLKIRGRIDEAVTEEIAAILKKEGPVEIDLERLKGPSSTWTYLVDENQFGWGMELFKTKNIGFAAVAAGTFAAPLLALTLIWKRVVRRKRESKLTG